MNTVENKELIFASILPITPQDWHRDGNIWTREHPRPVARLRHCLRDTAAAQRQLRAHKHSVDVIAHIIVPVPEKGYWEPATAEAARKNGKSD